ncbi:MAG: hypothetical protein C0406_02875 [Sideroxydans sp.]|nr:hypothetical protein [Sideroxydans sp.]
MNRILLLVIAVLVLAACQAKKPDEVAAVPAAVVTPAPAPVTEPVVVKPVELPLVVEKTAPVVVAPVPVAETKPAVAVAPQPVAVPVAVPKPVTQPAIAKPVAPVAPAAPKVVVAAFSDADGVALAKKRNCFACHMVDKKVVGPAWKDVAAKYRGDAGAQARMEAKIGKGGSGAWGSMAMPPQPQVTAEERALLARFILNLK